MTDEAATGTGTTARSQTLVHPALAAEQARAGQLRLDEIGRALGLMRRRLESPIGPSDPPTSQAVTRFQCPTCGHERWTATGCAVCALFGPGR